MLFSLKKRTNFSSNSYLSHVWSLHVQLFWAAQKFGLISSFFPPEIWNLFLVKIQSSLLPNWKLKTCHQKLQQNVFNYIAPSTKVNSFISLLQHRSEIPHGARITVFKISRCRLKSTVWENFSIMIFSGVSSNKLFVGILAFFYLKSTSFTPKKH